MKKRGRFCVPGCCYGPCPVPRCPVPTASARAHSKCCREHAVRKTDGREPNLLQASHGNPRWWVHATL